MSSGAQIYPFRLAFQASGALAETAAFQAQAAPQEHIPSQMQAAVFPFLFDDKPIAGVSCIISGRSAGDMGADQETTRRAFLQTLGIQAERVYACGQTHGQNVAVIGGQSPRLLPDTDGLVCRAPDMSVPDTAAQCAAVRDLPPHIAETVGATNSAGAAELAAEARAALPCLSVTVADCLPVYLFDIQTGAFGIAHSGWKGTGIALKALAAMKARPEAVAAVLGPCICGECYRVDEGRRRAFEAEFGGEGGAFPLGLVVKGDCLDLQAANARLLANAGVRNIAVCRDCTFTDGRLGSFRREGKPFTRMLAMAGYTANLA